MQEIAEYVLMLPHLLLAHTTLSGSADFASDITTRWRRCLIIIGIITSGKTCFSTTRQMVRRRLADRRDGYAFNLSEGRIAEGTHSVINAYYVGAVKAMNRLAGITGRPPFRTPNRLSPLIERISLIRKTAASPIYR